MKEFLIILVLSLHILLCISSTIADAEDPRNLFHDYAVITPTIYGKDEEFDISKDDGVIVEEQLSVQFSTLDSSFKLNLKAKRDLLSEKYVMSYQEGDQTVVEAPSEKMTSCYYQGSVENAENSWAAVSICGNLRGAFYDGSETYFIEPASATERNAHYLFKESDAKYSNTKCEYEKGDFSNVREGDFSNVREENFNELESKLRSKDGAQTQSSGRLTLEVFIIDDKAEYQKSNNDKSAVQRKNMDIINIADARYGLLNMSVSLVSTIIWTNIDDFTITSDSRATIRELGRYRKTILLTSNPSDVGTLLTGLRFDGGVTGVAALGGACTNNLGVAVFSDHNVVGLVASTYTHELGHSLGMEHDQDVSGCQCPVDKCVMNAYAGDKQIWSSCSQEYARTLPNNNSKACLSTKV